MNEEKRTILEMLSKGTITSVEAEKLLDAVDSKSFPSGKKHQKLPKYLYVRVDAKDGADNNDQVKITIPLALVKAGMNFLSLLPVEARETFEKTMASKGFDFSVNTMKDFDADSIISALQELDVDIETSGNTVRIHTG